MKSRTPHLLHTFRSKVLGMEVLKGRLLVATERGVYLLDKNQKRFRKVQLPKIKRICFSR